MAVLTKDDILTADDLRTEVVSVPEWGGDVIVSETSAEARDEWVRDSTDENGEFTKDWQTRFLVCCIVDNDGERLFDKEDIEALRKKSRKALDRVFKVAYTLNGMNQDEVEKN